MALIPIPPVAAQVRWDRRQARPATVRFNGRKMRIVALAGVRDERAAYPAQGGPRVTFVVEAMGGDRAALVFDGRRRRWFMEAFEPAA